MSGTSAFLEISFVSFDIYVKELLSLNRCKSNMIFKITIGH